MKQPSPSIHEGAACSTEREIATPVPETGLDGGQQSDGGADHIVQRAMPLPAAAGSFPAPWPLRCFEHLLLVGDKRTGPSRRVAEPMPRSCPNWNPMSEMCHSR